MSSSIPQDPLSSIRDTIHTSEEVSSAEAQLSSIAKDTQESLAEEISARLAAIVGSIPQLEKPKSSSISIMNYYKVLSDVTRKFRQQLSISEQVDQQTRRNSGLLAIEQSQQLLDLYKLRDELINKITEDARKLLANLQEKLKEMQEIHNGHQELLNLINEGNALEQQKFKDLLDAQEAYYAQLKAIGVTDQGDGNWLIPEGAEDKFNYFTEQYQAGVDKFNVYWEGRVQEKIDYNAAVIDYNKAALEYNKYITDFISQNNLGGYLDNLNMKIPLANEAELFDLSDYPIRFEAPDLLTDTPVIIHFPPLPAYFRETALNGPPLVKLPPLEGNYNIDTIFSGIYSNLYDIEISPIDQQIKSGTSYYWIYVNESLLFKDTTPDPVLNRKPLALRLLPDMIYNRRAENPSASINSTSLAMQNMGFSEKLTVVLGQAILKDILEKANLKSLQELSEDMRQQKLQELTDHLLLASLGQLSNQSMQALFPAFSIIADSLSTLPKDSPAFALLFAVSLANRIQENSLQGISADALKAFIKNIPELSQLSPEDQEKLIAALNLGQLLVVGKLLEESLGLPGTLMQILPSISTQLPLSSLFSQAGQETQEELFVVQGQIENHFISEGIPADKAQFLAQAAVKLIHEGLSAPTVTAVTTPQNLNTDVLVDSVKAGLILNQDYPLEQADVIAHEAVDLTLLETPYPSAQQFRAALDGHLKMLGVPKSIDISTEAIMIPPRDPSLSPPLPARVETSQFRQTQRETIAPPITPQIRPEVSPREAISTAAVEEPDTTQPRAEFPPPPQQIIPVGQLTQAELMAILEKRSFQLLNPQLGPQIAKEITEEIAKTLFGQPNPQMIRKGEGSPLSFVNTIKTQVEHLNLEQNEEWATEVTTAFKETVKTMVEFHEFALKLMDPANLFILSAHAGIIYSDHGQKKLDIIV